MWKSEKKWMEDRATEIERKSKPSQFKYLLLGLLLLGSFKAILVHGADMLIEETAILHWFS